MCCFGGIKMSEISKSMTNSLNKSLSNSFEELKQRCVDVVNAPTGESIASLRAFVLRCDDRFINSLYQYAIFPLRVIIDKLHPHFNSNEMISSVDCLATILVKSSVNRFDIFSDIFAHLFHLIDANSYFDPNTKDLSSNPKLNEDLVLSVVKCCQSLVKSIDKTASKQLISDEFSPQLGHAIHILLNIAVNEKYSLLKVEAMNTIGDIIGKCESIDYDVNSNHTKAEDVIAFFLPGISTNICKIITSDDKLGKNVINSCLKVLSQTIIFVFKDEYQENARINTEKSNKNPLSVKRDNEWIENTCDKLCVVFKSIISHLISHPNWNVRQSLSIFAINTLSNCSSIFVNKCLPVLLQVPLTYLNDEYDIICSTSNTFIEKLSKYYINDESSKNYKNIIQDEIYAYISRLPRLVRTQNEREKTSSIYLLNGYLKCLGCDGINSMLYSLQHKERLFQCLVDILELDFKGIQVLEQSTNLSEYYIENDKQLNISWCKKNFVYLTDEKSITGVENCCHQIGINGDYYLLIDFLIDSLNQSKLNPSVIFLSNSIVSGLNCEFNNISELLELYISSLNISSNEQTIEQMNKEIVRTCLLIEGLAVFVKFYNRDSSYAYLLKCFYPLLELAGSSNTSVAHSSIIALNLVAKHFSYISISEMIAFNIDYLINFICIKLKYFLTNKSVTLVIQVMLKYSAVDLLQYYSDPIEEILAVVDSYHHMQALPLMCVLSSFISSLFNAYEFEHVLNENHNFSLENKSLNVLKDFEDFVESKMICENLMSEEKLNDSDINEFEENKIKKENPFYIPIIEEILKRCVHLISSKESKVRLIVLDIVIQSLQLLSPFEDNLLPNAHNLWPPLVDRFADKDIIVVKRAFCALIVMSKTCRDFIRLRTVKEVIPRVLTFLRSQRKHSYKKDLKSAYRFTIAYQYQHDILNGIAFIAVNLNLRSKELWQLIVEVIPYLSSLQPKPLQDAAFSCLEMLTHLDSNSVFYYLTNLYFPYKSASHSEPHIFSTLYFNDDQREYEKNINFFIKKVYEN